MRALLPSTLVPAVFAAMHIGCGGLLDYQLVPVQNDASALPPPEDASTTEITTNVDDAGAPRRDSGSKADAGLPDAGPRRNSGACSSDAECPGGTCVELVSGGYRVCAFPPPPPRECADGGFPPDECCGTCATGTCTIAVSCGGANISPHNVCVTDECTKNSDCGAGGICLPTGVGSAQIRTCLRDNGCLRDLDCASGASCKMPRFFGPLSVCSPFACGGGPATTANPLRCVSPSECLDDGDCAPSGHCEEDGGLRCAPGVRAGCLPPP